ncbi:MAG: pyruvate, phosphate dikinase [Polyangiaceae bacterium UTPRO1]|jgi:pyruvate,orthophosphate dikinase|nr:pyruvate, phosphate dikinase [Myxococcales bacterium]OQY69208.1 MAG: pyruvate, phosphate dikinase [Polyangiaceae bacterium UTPRO1]
MAKSSRGKSRTKSTKSRAATRAPAKSKTRKVVDRARKYVYAFGGGRADGTAAMKNLLGGKGANLAEMAGMGLPVPPGFTISTEVCTYYYANRRTYPAELKKQVAQHLARIESLVGRNFGDPVRPLLVSVRSGARASMPGMMDTVLNLGLNDATVQGLIADSKNERFAWDSYRRFVQMYGDVVLGLKPEDPKQADPFEEILERKKQARGAKLDTELTAADLKELVAEFKAVIKEKKGTDFPSDPHQQLWGAIGAVFGSWQNARAITYRRLYGIPDEWGTAVNVQAMVFGNLGDDCATGVGFSRDPATGERRFYGDFLVNAQGEDVVAGIRTPQPLSKAAAIEDAAAQGIAEADRLPALEEIMPDLYKQLTKIAAQLEKHYRDMQDIEFTIERGRLYMLQTRNGKRTAHAAIKIAVDMVKERLIDRDTAIARVEPSSIDQLLHPGLDPKAEKTLIAKGVAASPGAVAGEVVFSADDAEAAAASSKKVILVRVETSPEDIHGMSVAEGILTARGGKASHAAVVARGMGKSCVAGCSDLDIRYDGEYFLARGSIRVGRGEWITLDGSTGEVFLGKVPTVQTEGESGDFAILMSWADKARRLKIRTNADTPKDAAVARKFGAEGIGLCRTEHMFFEAERIDVVREMILAADTDGRERALAKLLPMQRGDFIAIFREMNGLPVTIRLLDPPLHEFLPQTDADTNELAAKIGVDAGTLRARRDQLHELNPMLGLRGCRLGIVYPEIYRMQVRAIMEAACTVAREGAKVIPEIMIPLVGHVNELARLRKSSDELSRAIIAETGQKVAYTIGTMVEVPRACLTADEIAREAEFFSFGTNDLTQMGFGLSRDDAATFLPQYVESGILPGDPFASLDEGGIGQLLEMGVRKGRGARAGLKIGICGEHGGDPSSIAFCHRIGLDYVSCSPYRVPVARLAAAQAAIAGTRKKP